MSTRLRPACAGALALGFVLPLLVACADSGSMKTAATGATAPDGAAVFAANCAICHALPILASLREQNHGRPPGFVYDAITHGNMRRMGSKLDEASRRAVAEYFTGVPFSSKQAERHFEVSPRCDAEHARFDWSDAAYPSWGNGLRNARAVADGAGITKDAVGKLAVKWVVAFPESSQLRSQATAAGGALFVGSHDGSVYALDQAMGCTRWQFKSATEVRSAVTIDVDRSEAAKPVVRAVFGDRAANVHALDAETGEVLWSHVADPHPNAAITGSITSFGGLYFVPISSNDDLNAMDPSQPCCTHHGSVVALDARTGAVVWRRPTVDEEPKVTGRTTIGTAIYGPSGASVWNTPTVDETRGLLFVGTGNNHSRPATAMSDSILALDVKTGRVVWTYQAQAGDAWNAACAYGNRTSCPDPEGPDTDFGGTTTLASIDGRDVLVAGQKSGLVHALDPATGRALWTKRIVRGGADAGIRYGLSNRDGVVFVPSMIDGDERGENRETLPGLVALRVSDGQVVWQANGAALCAGRTPCIGIVGGPPLATGDVVFASGIDGTLYGLDRASGAVLWHFDTTQDFETLLGRKTRGGGIQGTAGPMVANGRLFVSSGYGQAQRPGNALIAFGTD